MQREPVSSSQIVAVGYDPETETLEIEFQRGAVYQYDSVDAETHRALMGAESVGEFFSREIKGKFAYARV